MSNATLVSTTLAGTIATLAECSITYPLEYVKVRRQMAVRPLASGSLPPFSIPHLTSVFYQGWSAFLLGNALKTWIRFNVFNSATKFMSDSGNGRTSAPVVVVSGMITGIAETLVVVPFESIKTTMIEASSVGKGAAIGALPPLGAANTRLVGKVAFPKEVASSPASSSHSPSANSGRVSPSASSSKSPIRPKQPIRPAANPSSQLQLQVHPITGPQGFLRTVRDMYRNRGMWAFVQGFNPTVIRQVANSAFRFTSWNAWSQLVALEGEERMPLSLLLLGTGISAAVEAVATQPLDVVKTRMQTANGKAIYGNALVCAYKLFTEEGWKQFWAGVGPRWIRKWVGGGIMWAVYELSYDQIDSAMREHPFK